MYLNMGNFGKLSPQAQSTMQINITGPITTNGTNEFIQITDTETVHLISGPVH